MIARSRHGSELEIGKRKGFRKTRLPDYGCKAGKKAKKEAEFSTTMYIKVRRNHG
jgi:hypothetical protein